MITIEIEEKADKNWNKRLLSTEAGTIYQTQEMGIHFERLNKTPLFLKFFDKKGEIIGQLLLGVSSRFENKGKLRNILKKMPGIKKELIFWSYGPVIFDSQSYPEVYSELGKFLLSKNFKVNGWTNPFLQDDPSLLNTNFQIKKWATSFIDLTKTKDELYKNIHKHSCKKNIERSKERGVVVKELSEKDLVEYNKFTGEIKKEQIDYQKLLDWWKLLKPLGYSGFMAKWNDKPVGGIMFSFFNRNIIEGGVLRSTEDYKNNLYSQDLIKWKIIEWGVKNKMRFYNLAGFNPFPENKKEEGIKRYKMKWGGETKYYWVIKNN